MVYVDKLTRGVKGEDAVRHIEEYGFRFVFFALNFVKRVFKLLRHYVKRIG